MRSGFTSIALVILFITLPDINRSVQAEITRVVIQGIEPYGQFKPGKYIRVEGVAHGALSPSEAIPDLDKAPRNALGRVEYRTPFTLLMPEVPRAGNGTLLVDIPNRGRAVSHAFYNSPRSRPILAGSLDEGTGFLQNRGFSVVVVQWELGEGIELPAFVDASGIRRFVEGVGFAAVRDIALYIRDDRTSGNPLASAVDRAYAVGYSQTARFLKSFVVNGFNESNGKSVFAGVHIVGAAAGVLPLLGSGPGPQSIASNTPSHSDPENRGVHEEPFTYEDVVKRIVARGQSIPRVIVAHMHTDYLTNRASLTRTGASGVADLPIPENVRMYDITGAAHLNVREQNKACKEQHGQMDWSPALRAQLSALDAWIRNKTAPPPSQLMPLEPHPGDSQVLGPPTYLAAATIMIPKLGADGNAIGGQRLPDIRVPIATHGNVNSPMTHFVCRLVGTYRPFAKTTVERKTTGDSRLSLEERYPGGINEYTSQVRAAARDLVAQRLLLEEDAIIIEHAAAENTSFSQTKPRSRGSAPAPEH